MDLGLHTVCAIGSGTPLASKHEHRVRAVTLAATDLIDQWEPLIAEASWRFGIRTDWIRAAVWAESTSRTALDERPITWPVDAMGLMQVMPNTYENLRQAPGLGADPCDPQLSRARDSSRPCITASANPGFSPPTMPARNATTLAPARHTLASRDPRISARHRFRRCRKRADDGRGDRSRPLRSTRVAGSGPWSQPKFQSGRLLFFVFDKRTFTALEPSNQAAESATQDADQPRFS